MLCCCVWLSAAAGSALSYCSRVPAVRDSVRWLCLFLCSRLSDSDVRPIESFPSLTAIDVGGCHGLTAEALRSISTMKESGKRRSLQYLSLYWCPGLTDKGVQQLSSGLDCAALRHLSLRCATTRHCHPIHDLVACSPMLYLLLCGSVVLLL